MTDKQAVLAGMTKTGTVITAAGVIQGLAFLGLLFSREPILNQLSFFLFVSVVFDTLIIRTLLVPAIMAMLGRAAWWPRRFRKGSSNLEQQRQQQQQQPKYGNVGGYDEGRRDLLPPTTWSR